MGALKRRGSDEATALGSVCLIGRSAACDLRVDDPRVSGEHASLRWTDGAWELRDLGSRNGTFVGGRRLGAGERAPLAAGDVIALGGPGGPAPAFTLADASAPAARARSLATGAVRAAVGGLLVLPDDDHPRVSVFEDRDGRWTVEVDGKARPAADRDVVLDGGEGWALDLPAPARATLDAEGVGPTLETIALRFAVSRDEEHVELTVVHAGREVPLPQRSFHYLLLTLARARLAGAAAPEPERGWLDREELCRMLATDEHRLNVDVCRARKQLAAAGVHGAANVIERRAGTGRLRLGVERVAVRRL